METVTSTDTSNETQGAAIITPATDFSVNGTSPSVVKGLSAWGMVSAVIGVTSDLLAPLGPFAVWFLIVSLLAVVFTGIGSFVEATRRIARPAFGFSAVGAIVFGLIVGLQTFAAPGDTGNDRGVIAANVQPVASIQTTILPLSPTRKKLLEFSTELQSSNPVERGVAAREAMQEEDPLLRRAMMEQIFATGDNSLRQISLISVFSTRENTGIPIQLIEADGAAPVERSPLAKSLIGATFDPRDVSLESGAMHGFLKGRRFDGSISRDRIAINGNMELPDDGFQSVSMDFQVNDDFEVTGTASSGNGHIEKVRLVLF